MGFFGMVSDGFQAQKSERALANAMSIDGRKEWRCKFCSESNLWRCRGCYSNIPAGLQGEVQAGGRCKVGRMVYRLINVEWRGRQKKLEVWKQRTRTSEQGLMPWKRKEGVQGGPSISSREGGGSEDVLGESSEVEDEAESCRKLDEQKKKLLKEL